MIGTNANHGLIINGVNFVLYQPIWPEFIVPAGELVQKHPWFIPLKIPVLTELYRTYRQISEISAEKWIPGGTKNLKKMEKVSCRKLTMPFSLVVLPCCRPFPQPSSFYFIQPLLFFLLLLLLLLFLVLVQFWPRLLFLCLLFLFCLALVFFFFFFFYRISVWLLFNCFVWVLVVCVWLLFCVSSETHVNSNEFKFQIYLIFRLAATHIW